NEIQDIIVIDEQKDKEVRNIWDYSEGSFSAISLYPETTMNIQYSSGTTGRPKGCILSFAYWLSIGQNCISQLSPNLNESDTMMTAQPFYYMDPQWNVITSLLSGATLVVLDRF